jgi:DNA-binding MarR family transcriptional regulator
MAQIVHDLETAGLVSRRRDPADGRRAFVELTAAGLEVLHTTRASRETWLTEALDRELDGDERALMHDALGLLRRVADA